MDTQLPPRRRSFAGPADAIFAVSALVLFAASSNGMMDDPGLGWHLRIPDKMLEQRGFIYREPFCVESQGQPIVTYWLGDVPLRLAYQWSRLNGVAAITALTMALVLRILFQRMVRDGIPNFSAILWCILALYGTLPGLVARPNIFSFLGVACTALVCEEFHRGRMTKRGTLWLIPLFVLWANVHGGFLSGALILCATYFVEGCLSLIARDPTSRSEARERLKWWTGLGVALFIATLINPYGFGLYEKTLSMVTDSYIQRSTTTEWLPPDFQSAGWGIVELSILALPLLLATSKRKLNLVSLALCIVWLHFGLASRRYTPLAVVVLIPNLAWLSYDTPLTARLSEWIKTRSSSFRAFFTGRTDSSSVIVSIVFAILLLVGTRWMGPVAKHTESVIPTAALNELLRMHDGERVFHSLNWGGYLTLHGWNNRPRFQTWIDDRLDAHSRDHFEEYESLITADMGWESTLEQHQIELFCLPVESRLAKFAAASGDWSEEYRDENAVILRRKSN